MKMKKEDSDRIKENVQVTRSENTNHTIEEKR
jgi:hypothetical protein